ncbi:MAG: hypothetical protein GSR80_000763 [Desulfurococcales archaeon]|nr:hypothetical protein [Desulfurococcales archaeon]
MAGTRKVTIEVELPEEMGEEVEVERLIELLRRGVPLGVRRGELRRARLYARRARY